MAVAQPTICNVSSTNIYSYNMAMAKQREEEDTWSRTCAHVVVIPLPYVGHIHPLMELAKKLAAAGVSISFVNAHHHHEKITKSLPVQSDEEEGVPYLQDEGLRIRLLSIPCHLPDMRKNTKMQDFLQPVLNMQTPLEELMGRLHPKPTCLISDLRMPFAQEVADKFGIPRIAFWCQSAASFACTMFVSKGYRPPADKATLIDCIPGVPPLQCSELGPYLTMNPSDPGFEFMMRPFRAIGEAAAVVINTFDELEPTTMESLRNECSILSVGPLLPSSYMGSSAIYRPTRNSSLWPESYDCLKWLDAQPPSSVLYISFGTFVLQSDDELQALACVLDATEQRFLWVIRPESRPFDAADIPGEHFREQTKERGRVVSWAPQLQVLSHPSVGGFLSHCGWNSVMESLSRGVPMLGWPKDADQKLNNRCMAEGWRAGMGLEEGGDMQGKVQEVMMRKSKARSGMEEVRGNAKRWKEAGVKAHARGGSSHTNMSILLALLGAHLLGAHPLSSFSDHTRATI